MRRRKTIYAVLVLSLALLFLFAALHSAPARSWVRSRLVQTLLDSGIEARVADLSYNALTLRIRLERPRLAAVGRSELPFFEADSLVVDVPWSWFWSEPYLQDLEVLRPRIRMLSDSAGGNFPELSAGGLGDSRPLLPGFDRLLIEEASIEWTDGGRDAELRLQGVNLIWSPDAGGNPSGRLESLGGGLIRWGDRETSVIGLSTGLSLDGPAIALENLEITFPFGGLSGAASLPLREAAELSGTLTGTVDTERLAEVIGASSFQSRGILRLNAELAGTSRDPSVRVNVSGESLGLLNFEPVEFELDATINRRMVAISALRLLSGSARVDGSGSLPFVESSAAGRMEVEFSGLNTEALSAGLIEETTAWPAAALDGDITATWQGPNRTEPELRVEIQATPLAGSQTRLPLEGRLSMEIAGGRWTINADGSVADSIVLDTTATGELDGLDLAASTLDGNLSITIPAVGPLVSNALGSAPVVAGNVRAELDLSGSIRDPGARGSIGIDELSIGPVFVGHAGADIELDGTGLDVRSLTAEPAGGDLVGELHLDFSTGLLEGGARIDIVELADFARQAPERWRPQGTVEVRVEVDGRFDEANLAFELESGPLRLGGQAVDQVSAQGRWASGVLNVERFELHQSTGSTTSPGGLRASAVYRPADASFELTMTGEGLRLDAVPSREPGATSLPLAASFGLQVDGSGTFDAPSVQATIELAELDYRGARLGPLTADVTLDQDILRLEAISNVFSSRVSATLGTRPWGAFALASETDNLDLARVA